MKKDTKASTRKSKKSMDPAKKFERLMKKFKEKTPVHYKMTGSFEKDDLIDHDTFGMGVVVDTENKKIDVQFSDKLRTLVCDR